MEFWVDGRDSSIHDKDAKQEGFKGAAPAIREAVVLWCLEVIHRIHKSMRDTGTFDLGGAHA